MFVRRPAGRCASSRWILITAPSARVKIGLLAVSSAKVAP